MMSNFGGFILVPHLQDPEAHAQNHPLPFSPSPFHHIKPWLRACSDEGKVCLYIYNVTFLFWYLQ